MHDKRTFFREAAPTAGWYFTLYPGAGEGGGSFAYSQTSRRAFVPGQPAADPERSRAEAARRARAKLRRYCAANRCNRLGTLTYRGQGCHDPAQARIDVARFFRDLRTARGGKPFAYVWVPEWHKTGHGLHLHFAVGDYIPKRLINQAWEHGFTHIKLLSDLPVGSGRLEEARKAAAYLSKYVGKAFDGPKPAGLHRFDVAQGFQPHKIRLRADSIDDLMDQAAEQMGGVVPDKTWNSAEQPGWEGPPSVWMSWPN